MNHLSARHTGAGHAHCASVCSPRFCFSSSLSTYVPVRVVRMAPAGALLALLLPPVAAHAQSAVQATPSVVRDHAHASDLNVTHDTMPARLSDVVRKTPKDPVVPNGPERHSTETPAQGGFWDNMLLPPLTSRPEAYGQPQSLELKPLPTALMHQARGACLTPIPGRPPGLARLRITLSPAGRKTGPTCVTKKPYRLGRPAEIHPAQ